MTALTVYYPRLSPLITPGLLKLVHTLLVEKAVTKRRPQTVRHSGFKGAYGDNALYIAGYFQHYYGVLATPVIENQFRMPGITARRFDNPPARFLRNGHQPLARNPVTGKQPGLGYHNLEK